MQKTILLDLIHSQPVLPNKACERCKFYQQLYKTFKSESEYICHVISTTLKGGSNNLESFIIKQLVDNNKLMEININHKN